MIRLEHITKTYVNAGKKFNAADDVSLEIKKGEIFGIIGFSGAGKSTLVRCINLLERPDSGKVFINDKDITALRGAELRRQRKKIGMIFQHFNLFASRTVLQNVIFPIRYNGLSAAERRKKALELLKLVPAARSSARLLQGRSQATRRYSCATRQRRLSTRRPPRRY